jgi:hypothetical protein
VVWPPKREAALVGVHPRLKVRRHDRRRRERRGHLPVAPHARVRSEEAPLLGRRAGDGAGRLGPFFFLLRLLLLLPVLSLALLPAVLLRARPASAAGRFCPAACLAATAAALAPRRCGALEGGGDVRRFDPGPEAREPVHTGKRRHHLHRVNNAHAWAWGDREGWREEGGGHHVRALRRASAATQGTTEGRALQPPLWPGSARPIHAVQSAAPSPCGTRPQLPYPPPPPPEPRRARPPWQPSV